MPNFMGGKHHGGGSLWCCVALGLCCNQWHKGAGVVVNKMASTEWMTRPKAEGSRTEQKDFSEEE